MSRSSMFRPVVLAILIVLGFLAQSKRAQAAELETLTVAGGCFWCIEADFEMVGGVSEVISGFTGGTVANPDYKQVTKGGTGHYEAVQIMFDPARVSRAQLLNLFFRSIDPTDSGGQFCDRGEGYRTAIFAADSREEMLAEQARSSAQSALGKKVVTPVLEAKEFYPADADHQDFYKSNQRILTRYGYTTRAKAYKKYRTSCGRDKRVRELWGNEAPFAGG